MAFLQNSIGINYFRHSIIFSLADYECPPKCPIDAPEFGVSKDQIEIKVYLKTWKGKCPKYVRKVSDNIVLKVLQQALTSTLIDN